MIEVNNTSKNIKVAAIVAMSENRVIGVKNALPWRISEDAKRFSKLTTNHTVLMGRKTYESLPNKFRPLPNRHNVVLTRQAELKLDSDQVEIITSFDEYLNQLNSAQKVLMSDRLWIIGGEEIYRMTLSHCDEVYLTLVKGEYEGDAYFPEFESEFEAINTEEHDSFSFIDYTRKK